MDKKKLYKDRKKHTLRKATLAKGKKDRESLRFLQDMQTQGGLLKLFLSPLTQKILECRIGENITPENRWVFVKKEKIEDNMFLHDTSSEFLPIKKIIERYPEPEMLIGSYSHIQDKKTDFFICTTLDVKDDIITVIETEKQHIYERMWNLLHPHSRSWKDLGSEIEIDECMSKNNRALFEIVVTSEFPIPYHSAKFTLCLVKDIRNSYMETVRGRFPYNIVLRKRVDASTQSTLPRKDKSIQSILSVLRNKHVQYSYHSVEFKMTENALEQIKKFFINKCDILYETLLVNFNINLFCDDYKELAINDKGISFRDPIELRSYQDVINCKHKKVSCVSWNSLVSGMVAVAYTVTPIYYVGKHARIHNDAEDTVYEQHLILLWTYKDNVRPKLYIHAYREVTALSFCPYDANILVGGYSNGQIVAWDIKNRVSAVETREVLTQLEYYHRAIMMKQTSWIKPPFSVKHVFPTITSLFGYSHSSAITSIKWIPPSHYISNLGLFEKSESSQNHMQFFSISLNGSSVLVWDLKGQRRNIDKKTWKKRNQRLSKLPQALAQTISPLKKLQKAFVPHYKLNVKDPLTGVKSPWTSIIATNQKYAYDVMNPKTIGNIEERTYFRVRGSFYPFNAEHKLLLTSALGNLAMVKWEGSSYSQGMNINSEQCSMSHFANVHDGPITSCELNPLLPEVLLTIGGSVFAIWKCEALNIPLVWRKSNSRYISGMWSFRHPLTLFMIRSDSYFEIWNFLEKSEIPVRSIKCKGNQLISLFSDPFRLHARKNTFITSDIVGAIKVFSLPTGIISLTDNSKDECVAYIEQMIAIKKNTEELKSKVKKTQEIAAISESLDEETQFPASIQSERLESKVSKAVSQVRFQNVVETSVNKWQKRLEIHMYKILIEKKNLNIEEIERNRIPMQEIMEQESRKRRKINQKMVTRERDFKKIKDSILVPIENQKIRRKITITLPKELTKILKQKYYENFKKIEAETIKNINRQSYKFDFNWNQMLQFGIHPST